MGVGGGEGGTISFYKRNYILSVNYKVNTNLPTLHQKCVNDIHSHKSLSGPDKGEYTARGRRVLSVGEERTRINKSKTLVQDQVVVIFRCTEVNSSAALEIYLFS